MTSERERERRRDTDRERERGGETQTERERGGETQTERERERAKRKKIETEEEEKERKEKEQGIKTTIVTFIFFKLPRIDFAASFTGMRSHNLLNSPNSLPCQKSVQVGCPCKPCPKITI